LNRSNSICSYWWWRWYQSYFRSGSLDCRLCDAIPDNGH
jgi:hypothetical protein